MTSIFSLEVDGPFRDIQFRDFAQTMTMSRTGNLTTILVGAGNMIDSTTYQVSITPQNSEFQTNRITFLPRANTNSNLFAEGRMHRSLFVVEGEMIKFEFHAVDGSPGSVQ